MKRFVIVVAALAGLGALLAGAYTLGTRRSAPAAASTTQQPPRRAVLYWYDPMRPDQHFSQPG